MGDHAKLATKAPEAKRENITSQTYKPESSQFLTSPVDRILSLQRTLGNQAVQRMMKSGTLQAKLRIGQPGDIYEQEADRVANQVMRMPEPLVQRQPEEEEKEEVQTKPPAAQITPLVQRQPEEEEEEEPVQTKSLVEQNTSVIQKQVEEEEEEEKSLQAKTLSDDHLIVQRQREEEQEEEEEGPVQTKPLAAQITSLVQRKEEPEQEDELIQTKPLVSQITPMVQRQEEPEEEREDERGKNIQAKEDPGNTPEATPQIAAKINTSHGGQPLQEAMRRFFEPRFGMDFRGVRVHTESSAMQMNHELGSQAFTYGNDIYFNSGKYDPGSTKGKRLLAHELTHAVQQGGSPQENLALRQETSRLKIQHLINRKLIQQSGGKIEKMVVGVNSDFSGGSFRVYIGTGRVLSFSISYVDEYSLPADGTYWAKWDSEKRRIILTSVSEKDIILNFSGSDKDIETYKSLAPKVSKPIPILIRRTGRSGSGTKSEQEGVGGQKEGSGVGAEKRKQGITEGTGAKAKTKVDVDKFLDQIKGFGSGKSKIDKRKLKEFLEKLSPDQRQDLIHFLNQPSQQSSAGSVGDFMAELEKFSQLSAAEREILRANLLIASGEGTVPISEAQEILLNIEKSASETEDLEKQVGSLNGALAQIHDRVSKAGHDAKELEPIDLSQIPAINEMMMLEGLLAGAGFKSEEIQGIAEDLTGSIGELRSYIQTEINWLLAELAASVVIGALLAKFTAGASLAAAANVLHKLNKLRQIIDKINRAYSVYNFINNIVNDVNKILGGVKKFQEIKQKIDVIQETLGPLQKKLATLDDPDDTLMETIEKMETELEDILFEELIEQGGLDALFEKFYLPADMSDEDFAELIFGIPDGLEKLKELINLYDPDKPGSKEYTTQLSVLAFQVGMLLYPLVGFLADQVSGKLSGLMREKSLGERFIGLAGRARKRRGARKMPKTKKERKKTTRKEFGSFRKRRRESRAQKAKARKAKAKQDAASWKAMVAKFSKIPAKYKMNGATKKQLKGEISSLKARYGSVIKSAPVKAAIKRPKYWRIVITPKSKIKRQPGVEAVTRDIRMSSVERVKRAKKMLRARLAKLDPQKVDIAIAREKLVLPAKKLYLFKGEELKIEKRDKPVGGLYIFGSIGSQKDRVFLVIEDLKGLHTGEKDDPIPIYWYKNPNDYEPAIQLVVGGKFKTHKRKVTKTVKGVTKEVTVPFKKMEGGQEKTFSRISSKRIADSKRKKVQVGINGDYDIQRGKLLKRKKVRRTGEKQRIYRRALEERGYDWTLKDADHVRDLAFEGPDAFSNLWPLEGDINRIAFKERWYMLYEIEYLDKTEPNRVSKSTLFDKKIMGKFFRVIGFSRKPPDGPDGRGRGSNK